MSCGDYHKTISDLRNDYAHPYYRIYVGNYIVFYCVVGDATELLRFVCSGRNWKRFV